MIRELAKFCPDCNHKSVGMWCPSCFPTGYHKPFKWKHRAKLDRSRPAYLENGMK